MRRCLRKRRKERKSIAAYIMDMKELDVLLQNMCIRIEADIKKTSKEPKITKAVLRRRLLLKKHYKNVDDRRTQILGRILQLENLHLNTLQVQSLKNVTKAHSEVNINPDDVEELIDKLTLLQTIFKKLVIGLPKTSTSAQTLQTKSSRKNYIKKSKLQAIL